MNISKSEFMSNVRKKKESNLIWKVQRVFFIGVGKKCEFKFNSTLFLHYSNDSGQVIEKQEFNDIKLFLYTNSYLKLFLQKTSQVWARSIFKLKKN